MTQTGQDRSLNYSWYVVGVLFVAGVFSSIDRFLLNLFVEPIKAELGLSDTQIGMLQGLAFTLFYATLGLPIGRLVDSVVRRTVLAAGVGFWSLMTLATGFTQSYWQLFFARAGVGAGEASLFPSSYSLIADYFPKTMLGRAIGVFTTSAFIGSGLALLLGGTIIGIVGTTAISMPWGEMAPWRFAFLLAGAPGILIALTIMLTVREPARKNIQGGAAAAATQPTMKEVTAYCMARWRLYVPVFLGMSAVSILHYGNTSWAPTFLIRTYGWSATQVGIHYGVVVLIAGAAGAIIAGTLADRLTAKGRADATLRLILLGCGLILPFVVSAPLAPNPWAAMLLLGPISFFMAFPYALAATTLQLVTPNRMRGLVTAGYIFTINMIGHTLGPLLVGAITDFVFKDEGQIRFSLLAVGTAMVPVVALLMWSALKPMRETVAAGVPD